MPTVPRRWPPSCRPSPGNSRTAARTAAFITQVEALHFFDQVLDARGLAKLIAAQGLGDKVVDTNEPISLNRLYHAYTPFLWLHFESGGTAMHPTSRLIVTNPDTLDDLFVAESELSFWNGVTNEQGFHPLFNALSGWLMENR